MEMNKVSDTLPVPGRHVLLINDQRRWNTPDGVDRMPISDTGYLSSRGDCEPWWSTFGNGRAMQLKAFTHWAYVPELIQGGCDGQR